MPIFDQFEMMRRQILQAQWRAQHAREIEERARMSLVINAKYFCQAKGVPQDANMTPLRI